MSRVTDQFQYQAAAEPITTRASIYIDKWIPEAPDRLWVKVGLVAAITAGSFFFTPVPTTYAWIDNWQPKTEDYRPQERRTPAAIESGSFFGPVTFKEDVRPDKFEPSITDIPNRSKTGLIEAIQAGSFVIPNPVAPVPGDFAGGLSLHNIQRYQYQSQAAPVLVAPVAAGIPAQFLGYQPEIVRGVPPLLDAIQSGSFFFVRHIPKLEYVTPDKWLPVAPEIVPPRGKLPEAIMAGSVFEGDLNRPRIYVPTADRLALVYPTVVYPKEKLLEAIQSGSFFFGDIPRPVPITVAMWLGTYPDMILQRAGLPTSIQSGSGLYEQEAGGFTAPTISSMYYYLLLMGEGK